MIDHGIAGTNGMVGRLFLIAATALLAAPAAAAGPVHHSTWRGTWVIAEGHPAPWVDPARPSTEPFDDHIVGRTVTFAPTRIVAPPPLSCRHPAYALHEVRADALFQGALPRPEADAARLGFARDGIPTLDTNCNAMFEYHFTPEGTALFALNNTIYVLRRR